MKNIKLLLFLLLGFTANAQQWDAGLLAGFTGYQGDINKFVNAVPKTSNMAGGVFIRKYFDEQFALRANLYLGKISGNDKDFTTPAYHAIRGFSFSTTLTEISLQGEFRLWNENRRLKKDGQIPIRRKRLIVPYGIFGVGFAALNPTTNYNTDASGANPLVSAERIAADKADKHGNTHLVLPIGGGVRINISNKTSLGAELALRTPFTDYVDGISQAGNPKRKDWYATGVITLGRTFGSPDEDKDGIVDEKDKCPTVPGLKTLEGCPDGDLDGVSDEADLCPETPGKKALMGCPDTDNDGVADKDDKCPDVAGVVALGGCPDGDSDGVADKDDKCPTEVGTKEHQGCPFIDRDKDGIADNEDICPDLPGQARYAGCPDTDGDGVSDDKDSCPTKSGLLVYAGCPDTDGDGVSDNKDGCPTVVGPVANNGCPYETVPKEIVTEVKSAPPVVTSNFDGFVKKVYFSTNKSLLSGENVKIMNEVADYLKIHPEYDVKIGGHTDNTGGNPSNRTLSEYRAKSCLDYLKGKGIAAKRMTFVGYAFDRPDADNATEAGRTLNRRVEFEVFKR